MIEARNNVLAAVNGEYLFGLTETIITFRGVEYPLFFYPVNCHALGVTVGEAEFEVMDIYGIRQTLNNIEMKEWLALAYKEMDARYKTFSDKYAEIQAAKTKEDYEAIDAKTGWPRRNTYLEFLDTL